MSYSSQVPTLQFTPTGVVLPAEADILAGVQQDISIAFGGGVNPALETPQGQLASSDTAIIADKNSEIAYVTNQVDPQYASGRFQDAIGRIYFMTRQPATATMVTATLGGAVFAVVPSGTQAQDTSGNSYTLMATVTIGSTGTVQGVFQNILTGPIPCPDNTLTKVYQAVSGWDSVNNPTLAYGVPSAFLGNNVESRAEFEYRRQNSVAINGQGTLPSIYANVFAVSGVSDCYAIDNPLSTVVDKGSTNYPLADHSIYVAVVGGDDTAIAQAIWGKKDGGCTNNGNTTVTVIDPSGYEYPQPSYAVKFNRPSALPIYFAVQIVNSPSLPYNIVSLIHDAIIAQFTGANGAALARIGSLILSTNYYGAIASVAPNVLILSAFVGASSMPTGLQQQVGIDQAPSIIAANISVVLVTP